MPIYMMRESSPTPVTAEGVYWSSSLGLISKVNSSGNTVFTIADKNLGASVVWNEGDILSNFNCGNYYQRGNNYGFDFSGPSTTSSTLVDATGYGPGNYYSSSTFIARVDAPYCWWSTYNANLRGDTTNTKEARQGPCPSGFHVPTSQECLSCFNATGLGGKTMSDIYKLPPAGELWYDGSIDRGGTSPYGYYCTSSSYSVSSGYYNLNINYTNNPNWSWVYTDRTDWANAYSIRPFKNTVVQPDSTRTVLYQPV